MANVSKKQISEKLMELGINHDPNGNINELKKLLPEGALDEPVQVKPEGKVEAAKIETPVEDSQPEVTLGVTAINDLAQRIFRVEKHLKLR